MKEGDSPLYQLKYGYRSADPGAGGLSASSPAGGGLFQAVRKLGLKLDPAQAPMETLVVDHIEKIPTEN